MMPTRLQYWFVLFAATAACAQADPLAPFAPPQSQILSQIKFTQRLDNQTPLTAELRDEHGEAITLEECIANKPTILVMAYYRCPMLCNQVLNSLARTLRGVNFRPGKDISV